MYEKTIVMYIYTETPMHPGSGTVLNSPVDLPIQRERHTEYPIIQGSTLKGVLRARATAVGFQKDEIDKVFGPKEGDEGMGAITVTDAKILAFPVRTLNTAFAWVTCPFVLNRYQRDLGIVGSGDSWNIPDVKENVALLPQSSPLMIGNKLYLEDLIIDIDVNTPQNLTEILSTIQSGLPDDKSYEFLKNRIGTHLVIVSDTVFKLLVKYTTEVSARISIDPETGTAKEKALFYEEYLPADSLLYSLILSTKKLSDNDMNKLLQYNGKVIQIGGNETIGKGFARIKLINGRSVS